MSSQLTSKQFEDDTEAADDSNTGSRPPAPEYSFEGYTIELNEKIMLMPSGVAENQNAKLN